MYGLAAIPPALAAATTGDATTESYAMPTAAFGTSAHGNLANEGETISTSGDSLGNAAFSVANGGQRHRSVTPT